MYVRLFRQKKNLYDAFYCYRKRNPPIIGEYYKGEDEKKHEAECTCFSCSCNDIVAGYRRGPKNPYIEKLLEM